jgi:chromosome partitioning protein
MIIFSYEETKRQRMPVIALLNQKGGVGKTTLSVHLAAVLAEKHKVLLVDADPQESALDWSAQRGSGQFANMFPVVGLPKDSLHRELAQIARDYAYVIIDGPPGANKIARSAVVASDMVVIPVQPSPYDLWATDEIERIIDECEPVKPLLLTRFLINRLIPGTTLGNEIHEEIGKRNFSAFETTIRNRTEYAKAAARGMTALETEPRGPAAAEIRAWTAEVLAAFHVKTEEEHAANS